MEIGHVIAKLREKKGISQKELANILNVSAGAVALWEVNKRCPSLESLVNIADFFNVSMDEFFVNDRKNINYIPLEIKHSSKQGLKLLELFESMNEEGQDILYGKARELIREQRLEEKSGNREIQKAN
jgi:transcriptional regulator with XRE-family HTH domain